MRGPATPVERKCAPKPYGHIPFPADPLLSLGVTQTRPAPPHAARQRNPLDRWVRLSRRDPDWRPPEAQSRTDRPAQPRPSARSQRHAPQTLPDSLHDWRRHHDEWQRLVPAPALAARLDAIERITANPAATILRTARRLQGARERTLALARAARDPPRDRQRREADHPGEDDEVDGPGRAAQARTMADLGPAAKRRRAAAAKAAGVAAAQARAHPAATAAAQVCAVGGGGGIDDAPRGRADRAAHLWTAAPRVGGADSRLVDEPGARRACPQPGARANAPFRDLGSRGRIGEAGATGVRVGRRARGTSVDSRAAARRARR